MRFILILLFTQVLFSCTSYQRVDDVITTSAVESAPVVRDYSALPAAAAKVALKTYDTAEPVLDIVPTRFGYEVNAALGERRWSRNIKIEHPSAVKPVLISICISFAVGLFIRPIIRIALAAAGRF